MTSPDQPGAGLNSKYFLPANQANEATSGLSQFASADQAFWDDYAYNQWNPKFAGVGEPVDIIRLLAHAATANIAAIIGGLFNGWFGGGSVGDPQEVQYTIEAIKDAIINGYNVETKVQSGTWTKPANLTELVVICIGCGQNGENGQSQSRDSNGGLGGGFIAQQVEPESVGATTPYVVGLNGNPSSFGTHVVTTPGTGGISTSFGYTSTNSLPGDGGRGGRGGTSADPPIAGSAGGSSALATGGSGGANASGGSDRHGKPGTAGGNVSAGTVTKCGGGGGGGGGGGVPNFAPGNGGSGGPGGYPGGGGGGGGGQAPYTIANGSNGAGGIGATGIIWIFWR